MNPDDLQEAWRMQSSQTHLTIDAELLLKELQRNQRYFSAMIFWRDVREVGTSLLMIPLLFYMGFKLSMPWTWYLSVPALIWIAGFTLADRMRHRRRPPEPGEPLRRCVESSMAEVEHQIRLLRNVFWWYLLPPSVAILAFLGQLAWRLRSGGWLMALIILGFVGVLVAVYFFIYRMNQDAVHSELVPRRRELEALLASLKDETQ